MARLGLGAAIALLCLSLGCAAGRRPYGGGDRFGWLEARENYPRASQGAFDVRWSEQLTERWDRSNYIPVELSTAGFDPRQNRIYIGTTEGEFFAFGLSGRQDFIYEVGAGVEAAPATDSANGEIYLTSVDGYVHALDVNGEVRWKTNLSGAIRNTPVLTNDAVYVMGQNDIVTAMARDDGRILWTYEREPIEEITIAGHAGLLLIGGRLYTGFTDGAVVAIDPADGRLIWEIDTGADIEIRPGDVTQFYDIDTTPVMIGDTLYVASFTAGLYALDAANGSVRWREPKLRSIVGIAGAGSMLVLSSAKRGIILFDLESRDIRWEHPSERGAPTPPVVTGVGTVLYGETQGSLLALDLSDGHEVARLEGGYGFSGTPAVLGPVGAALSNGGRFLCLRIN